MSSPGEYSAPPATADPRVPLLNLSIVRSKLDCLHNVLSASVNGNTLIGKTQTDVVSAEISSAIHQIIINGTSLLSCSQPLEPIPASNPPPKASDPPDLKSPGEIARDLDEDCEQGNHDRGEVDLDCDVVELDAVELLAEHVHFCEICGKGFKRDANLRMHMRAHGNQFKTPEALSKPSKGSESPPAKKTRFSCPYIGCNRNKKHRKFRPLKSVICVKNHFKRSHCPKMYSCNRCNKKRFSVMADLKSHVKHCGESKRKCSCGTTFSRKDKLFGHMALFEGHMPAVKDDENSRNGVAALEEDEEEEMLGEIGDDELLEGLLDGFGAIEGCNLQEVLGSAD